MPAAARSGEPHGRRAAGAAARACACRYVFERLETSKKAIATAIFNFALSRIRRKEHDKVKQYESYFYPYSVFNFPLRWLNFGKFEEAERFQPVPDAAAQWLNDEFFAEQRLSGMNPTFIRALAPGDPRLDVLDGVKLAADVRAHAKKGATHRAAWTRWGASMHRPCCCLCPGCTA